MEVQEATLHVRYLLFALAQVGIGNLMVAAKSLQQLQVFVLIVALVELLRAVFLVHVPMEAPV